MGKLLDLLERKAVKDGHITPALVAQSINSQLQDDPRAIKRIAVVVEWADGHIDTAMSEMQYLELIGLYEMAKMISYEEMTE